MKLTTLTFVKSWLIFGSLNFEWRGPAQAAILLALGALARRPSPAPFTVPLLW
jgi:hypothetical protein